MADPDDSVRTRRLGAVLEVTLDRPPANAIDLATSRQMGRVFAGFRDDPQLRVAVLRTAGERFFSAGWDLKAAAAGDAVDGDYGVGGFGGIQELPGLNKPVLAVVEGMAVGGGFELALSCDLIYAADTASFALPEINAGTLADAATLRLPARMPHHVAMELLLTGRWMDVAEAHRWGLVNEVHPAERLGERVREVAAQLAAGPPLVYAAIKEVLRESQRLTFAEAMRRIGTRRVPDGGHAVLVGGPAGGGPRVRGEAAPELEGTLRWGTDTVTGTAARPTTTAASTPSGNAPTSTWCWRSTTGWRRRCEDCADITDTVAALDPDPLRYMWVDEGDGQIPTQLARAARRAGRRPAADRADPRRGPGGRGQRQRRPAERGHARRRHARRLAGVAAGAAATGCWPS